jgi:hypothetical protein
MKKFLFFLLLSLSAVSAKPCFSQLWSGLLYPPGSGTCTGATPSGCAVDWSGSGIPGGVPTGTQTGSTIAATGSDQTSAINAALAACGGSSGAVKYVNLAAGTFVLSGPLIPSSYCYLNGQGANSTILQFTSTSGNGEINLGAPMSGGSPAAPSTANDTAITGGLSAGSTSIAVASAAHISVGSLLSISELNSASNNVNSTGSEGFCNFCDNYNGSRSSGQTVKVTNVSGTTVTISPGLYWTYGTTLPSWVASTTYYEGQNVTTKGHIYFNVISPGSGANYGTANYNCVSGTSASSFPTNGSQFTDGTCNWLDLGAGTTTSPLATPFTPTVEAGVKNLQLYTVNGGTDTLVGPNISINQCEYCFVSGVEDNYTDADHVLASWDYGGEITQSYFSNAILHTSGTYDSCVQIDSKTSLLLFDNNILERLHIGINLEKGASGNVVSYNFIQAPFDVGSVDFVTGAIEFHGAHPEFNLFEGNILQEFQPDSIWGTSIHSTYYRNWTTGSMAVNNPIAAGRNAVSAGGAAVPCTGITSGKSCYQFQGGRAVNISYLTLGTNLLGNVVGSAWQINNLGYGGEGVTVYNSGSPQTDVLQWPGSRSYDSIMYDYAFGYGEAGDDGTWALDSTLAYSTSLLHGNYGDISNSVYWTTGLTHTLPASFYLSAKPSWWGSLPYPAIGPDVTGGSGPGGHVSETTSIPAQACYLGTSGGSYGGAGSPISFNAATCYSSASPMPPQITGNVVISGNFTIN